MNSDKYISALYKLRPSAKKRFGSGKIEVNYVTDYVIKKANRNYRGENKSTDVLSFFYPNSKIVGQVLINKKYMKKRDFLFVHALLHLAGLDHMNKKDREKMDKLTRVILGRII